MLQIKRVQLPDIKYVHKNPRPNEVAFNPELNELWIYNASSKKWARTKLFMDEEEI
jgi:hypothetical protein